MVNFAKSQAIVRTTSLEAQAKALTRNKNISIMDNNTIPDNIQRSLEEQGMANQDVWSPGQPLDSINPIGEQPRQFEYTIGQNIVQRPRSTEAISFDTMRGVIESYDVAQMAIEVRQDELRNLDWDIVPYEETEAEKYSSEINAVRKFFEHPTGDSLTFDEWQNIGAYDWLAFDAYSTFAHMTKGGKLGALEIVDGTTITPMVDYYGRQPQAPAPAFIQWVNGLPWTWLNRDQLIYKPHRRRSNKLYGFSPIEWLLQNINTDMRYQLYFLQYFTEGSIPETWINAPDGIKDPKAIKQLQDMYDTVMIGDQSQKHKAKFIPFGANVTHAKDTKFDVKFPEFLLTKTCAAFKVTPAELGFTEKVNKSSGETQENVHFRRSIKPSAKFFESIYTGIIHKYFGYTNLRFKFLNVEEEEDLLIMAQRDEIYLRNGVLSADEVRVDRTGKDVDESNPVPRMVMIGTTIMPVQDVIKQSEISLRQAEAETDKANAEAGQKPNDPQALETDEGVEESLRTDEEAADPQSADAKKAALDFFPSPTRRS